MRHGQCFLMYCMASCLAFLMGGCFWAPDRVRYKGTHNGLDFVVKTHETITWNGSRTDWILKLENHPKLPIIITKRWGTPVNPDGIVSTDWGPPYSDAIYGKSERMYFGHAPAYSSKGDDYTDSVARQHDYTMLYMPPESTTEDFAAYSALLKARWTAVDKALTNDDAVYFPHLIGLVRAPRQRFIRHFRGTIRGQPMVLRIDPDGYVNFGHDDESAEGNHMRHCIVQMPRKAIVMPKLYTWADYGATKADIQRFRDENGNSPEAFFVLED